MENHVTKQPDKIIVCNNNNTTQLMINTNVYLSIIIKLHTKKKKNR